MQLNVLNTIRKNNKISRKEIAKTLNISPAAVQKHIEKLKLKKIIKRIGPKFGGYWHITNNKKNKRNKRNKRN